MSDIRKWMKIIESVPPIFPDQPTKEMIIKQDATVMVDPRAGGGTGRYMHSTPNGAMIDIKGVARELSGEDFSLPERDYEDSYQKGNDWFHMSQQPDTIGSTKDNSIFRAGDIVKIADVYGAVIGPGLGVFVAYSTSGQEAVISFDSKEIVVPVANLAAALEQNSKDNFNQMDNDGVLSPMSLGSENVRVEQHAEGMSIQEPVMDHRDEFSKWISAVEEALSTEGKAELAEDGPNECGCGNWECSTCFPEPEHNGAPEPGVVGDPNDHNPILTFGENPSFGATPQDEGGDCPDCGYPHNDHDHGEQDDMFSIPDDEQEFEIEFEDGSAGGMGSGGMATGGARPQAMEEEDNEFIEKPKSGKGVKLGDIITRTEFRKSGSGKESPMTYGEENLDEDPEEMDSDDSLPSGLQNQADPYRDDDEEEKTNMINSINSMQNMGLSKDDRHYDVNDLENGTYEELRSCYNRVMGDVSEAEEPPKPTKSKTRHYLDDVDDILNPRQADLPTNYEEPQADGSSSDEPMNLPTASRDATQGKMRNMSPSDTMRDYMNRINPAAGGAEPELQDTPGNELVIRTADDVPAVISSAMQASGTQSPEWHTIDNLPGFGDRNIRGMGRQVFGMFTSTPIEKIKTIANVDNQGPNTTQELRAVAGWLQSNAEDLGEIDVSHGMAIPGYKPDVKEYRANGIRFHVVRDPMGQYIYAYPDKDAREHSPKGQDQGRAIGDGNTPKLRESTGVFKLKPTLFEQIQWDQEIAEAFVTESTLSKLIGDEKGGQKLVQWLHRKHKLGNDVDLKPAPFNQRLLWKEYKRNPDNFIIVAGSDGVAGIKPYEKYIKDRTEAMAKKGKVYDPGGDSTLPYQIIAFTDDGQQVDPALLRPQAEGEEGEERYSDPTVMKARMGLHHGKDMQNSDNVFNLLAEQIGKLQTVFITGGEEPGKFSGQGVEREKMKGRADMKKTDVMPEHAALQKIFVKLRPVLKTLANQALSQINRTAQRMITGGNFEGAQKVAASGHKLKQFLINLDKTGDITLNTSPELRSAIMNAIQTASGSRMGSDAFKEYLNSAASGNSVALKPVLDALRDSLVAL